MAATSNPLRRSGWTNAGTVTASGGTLNLGNATWSNTGTVTAAGATTNLGGTFTLANLGAFDQPRAGSVNLTGTLTNTGGTLAARMPPPARGICPAVRSTGAPSVLRGARRLEGTDQGGNAQGRSVTLAGDPAAADPIRALDLATTEPHVTISGGPLSTRFGQRHRSDRRARYLRLRLASSPTPRRRWPGAEGDVTFNDSHR